jgi:uncharacterized protein (TIGR02996 family)
MSNQDEQNRAFLQAIRDEPEDDTHRLVYADWLQDHGDEVRAEFIRVQCELAWLSRKDARRPDLERRERELLMKRRDTWLGPLKKVLRYDHCTFRRGFPEDLTLRPKAILDFAEELDRRVPAGQVKLYGMYGEPALQAIASGPPLPWLTGLELDGTDAGLRVVSEAASLPNLVEMKLSPGLFTSAGIQALVRSPHRGKLRRLSLPLWRIGDRPTYPPTAELLAEPGVPFRLQSLSLYGHNVKDEGVALLATAPHLAEVKELELTANGIGDPGAAALASSPYLRGLSGLDLLNNRLTSTAVRALVEAPLLDGIRHLILGINKIGDKGAALLASCPNLSKLELLELFSAELTDRGAEALAASPHLSNLTYLGLTDNALTDRGSQALFESPHLQRLESIHIGGQIVRDKIISQPQRKQWIKRLGKGARV